MDAENINRSASARLMNSNQVLAEDQKKTLLKRPGKDYLAKK